MKSLRAKLRKFFGFFKFTNLSAEAKKLGGSVTLRNVVVLALMSSFAMFIAAYLLRLDYLYCGILVVTLLLCLPSMIITRFRFDYERRRFDNTVDYLEQLIYSFNKSGKIRAALADVEMVATGNVKNTIHRMLDMLDYGEFNSKKYANRYEQALDIMQKEYDCHRMAILHNYLIEVEMHGGKSETALQMLLEDIRDWSDRILQFQTEKRKVRNNITASVFLAMLSCGIMINLIPREYTDSIVPSPIYQVGTAIVLMFCIFLYVYAANRIGGSYLDNEIDKNTTAAALDAMEYITTYNNRNHFKPALIKVIILSPLMVAAVYMRLYWAIPVVALLILFSVLQAPLKRNNSVHKVVREVNKMFPTWIRNLTLYLQTDNVQVAIVRSYSHCPAILKPEVKALISNLEKAPSSREPYIKFLKDFDTPSLKLSVNYLYALSSFGAKDMFTQLNYLIKQNLHLSITEDKLRSEDALAGFGLLALLPMLFAVIKLLIDLVLFINLFMGMMDGYAGVGW